MLTSQQSMPRSARLRRPHKKPSSRLCGSLSAAKRPSPNLKSVLTKNGGVGSRRSPSNDLEEWRLGIKRSRLRSLGLWSGGAEVSRRESSCALQPQG